MKQSLETQNSNLVDLWAINNPGNIPEAKYSSIFKCNNTNMIIKSNDYQVMNCINERFNYYLNNENNNLEKLEIDILFYDDSYNIDGIILPINESDQFSFLYDNKINNVVKRDNFISFSCANIDYIWRPNDIFISFDLNNNNKKIKLFSVAMSNKVAVEVGKTLCNVVGEKDYKYNFNEITDFIISLFSRSQNGLALHSASIEYKNQGVLIIAPSGVGKTTTALSLLANNSFKFMSDEITILKNNNQLLEIFGLFIPPRIVGERITDFDMLEKSLHKPKVKQKYNFPVEKIIKKYSAKQIKPKAIFFLERDSQGQMENHIIEKIDDNSVFALLMQQVLDITSAMRQEEQFKLILGLVENCKSYKLKLGTDIKKLPEIVSNKLDEIL